eukprot:3602390-Karenia_brevis.AAC.1
MRPTCDAATATACENPSNVCASVALSGKTFSLNIVANSWIMAGWTTGTTCGVVGDRDVDVDAAPLSL